MKQSKLVVELHPKQAKAFLSKNKIILCCSGIQGGKTTVGALWFLRKIASYTGEDNNFILGAPSYKILNQSTLPTFMKYAQGLGTYHKSDQEFHCVNGSKVYIRTSTDPDSIEGIQNVRAIWADELGKCKRQFWINAEGRAARTNAPIMGTTTPYGMNFVHSDLIKPMQEGVRDDIDYFEWLSVDNPTFPREEYERQKRILDPRTFRRKYMGIHERMEGLVYELSNDNFTDNSGFPRGTRYFASVDFGFSEGHEFALLIRAITIDGFRYDIDEFKQAGLDPNQQIAICKAKLSTYSIQTFYCDPSRPDMIAALNKAGIPAIGFHVGREAYKPLVPGINKHIELIRSGQYKILRGKCPELIDEYETYHWPEYSEEKVIKEIPVKMNDHLMDCARMMSVGTMNIKIKEPDRIFMGQKKPHQDHWDPAKKSKPSVGSWNSQ